MLNASTLNRVAKILIVDDESPIREVLSASLRDDGHTVYTAHDGASGLKAMKEHNPEIVFLDIWMPGTIDGIQVLTMARQQFPQIDFVMISGHGTIETAVKATKLGAWDFIEKPLSMDKILIIISNIIHYQQEREEKTALLNKLRRSIALLGEASQMVALKQMIAEIAPSSQQWILLTGENGSGRELTAQNIHYLSARASRPFVDINCANLPDDLIDLELFGYEKGAFAGVDKTVKGKLELAQGGTIFLDDITKLTIKAQEKILRIMQEKKITRVGGSTPIEVDVRLIAATHVNIEQSVKDGLFHEDLYRRLCEKSFRVPSLREHAEDIPALVAHFSEFSAKEAGFPKKEFSSQSMLLMKNHSWPGNVRELKNFIERIYILTPSEFVDVHDLHFAGLLSQGGGLGLSEATELPTFREARARFEKEYLVKKIGENSGNISRTAEVIGLERSYLHRKIKSFGIEVQKGSEEQ